jgi:hypothetical protein
VEGLNTSYKKGKRYMKENPSPTTWDAPEFLRGWYGRDFGRLVWCMPEVGASRVGGRGFGEGGWRVGFVLEEVFCSMSSGSLQQEE